jgi:hypothetical protein
LEQEQQLTNWTTPSIFSFSQVQLQLQLEPFSPPYQMALRQPAAAVWLNDSMA